MGTYLIHTEFHDDSHGGGVYWPPWPDNDTYSGGTSVRVILKCSGNNTIYSNRKIRR